MFKKIFTLSGAIATAFYPGFAFSTCEFEEQTDLTYQHKIESIEDYQKQTVDFAEGARKCIVSFRIKVDNEWYIATGDYVYGSKLSDDDGCSVAEERAKQDILRLVSPETVVGSKELVCTNSVVASKSEPTVDLFAEIGDNQCRNKLYTTVEINGLLAEVWECEDE